jgi:hypothetical protein
MYETIIDNVKGNIESKSFKDENTIVKGWAFSELKSLCPIRCKYNNTVVSTSSEPREHIANTFITKNILMCGWKAILPKNKYVDAQIKINDEWITFLCFNTFDELNTDIVKSDSKNSEITQPIDETINITPKKRTLINFAMNSCKSNLYVIDNFYVDPNNIREYGLEHLNKNEDNVMSKVIFYKTQFEDIVGAKVQSLNKYNINGIFTDKIEYVSGKYQYFAIICLTPDTLSTSGISLHIRTDKDDDTKSDIIGNVYNRLIILNTKNISSIIPNYNETDLFQLFAFDLD